MILIYESSKSLNPIEFIFISLIVNNIINEHLLEKQVARFSACCLIITLILTIILLSLLMEKISHLKEQSN